MKYFLYARKSTDEEDRQILSIEAQTTEVREYAKKEKLEVVNEFIESRTAKAPGRPIFNEMISLLEKGKAEGSHCFYQMIKGIIACSIKFKHFSKQRNSFFINNNGASFCVVEITDWRIAGIYAITHFLPDATLNILREVIYIIFALPESNREHKLALSSAIKAVGRES